MKVIYKTFTAAVMALMLVSCGSKGGRSADDLLARARTEFENGKYNAARMLIDSIKIVSPKAYNTLREAEILRREVLIKEKEGDVERFEAALNELVAKRDSLAGKMDFNKDKKYQDKGYYTVKSQALALNVQNNFLRASVYEDGAMYLTSFYRGKSIKHTTVKLTCNGVYASCDKPFLERNYKELGVNNERRDYKYGEDNGLMDFILVAQGKIEVELSGGNSKVTYTMRQADADALRQVLELTLAIKAVQKAEDMLGEAKFTLDFLKKSEERSAAAASKQE